VHHTPVKGLVWDLDNTLWEGVLLEGDTIKLRPGVREIIETLDRRGILQSIASRNDHDAAMDKLAEFGLHEYFLYPQISWGPKSVSVARIAEMLNIDTTTLAFVDDQPFERDEVSFSLPEVRCIDAEDLGFLLDKPEFNPRFVTDDARQRRSMYRAEIERRKVMEIMPPQDFLTSLAMTFTVSEAAPHDLHRLVELTARTTQLNSTGHTYSFEELLELCNSPDHILQVAGLDDAYGTYGKVGMALIERRPDIWHLRLLLMSCRVMSRGVGKVLLTHVLQSAAAETKPVQADFIRTTRNRMMYLTLKLAGFREISRNGDLALLQHDLKSIDPYPEHVDVRLPG
jgi:FkbH-like protein